MNIHIGLITYAIDVTPLVDSIGGDNGAHNITWHIYEHSANSRVNEANSRLREHYHVYIFEGQTNRGLARSWNDFLWNAQRLHADAMIIINDDMQASRDDILKLAQGCVEHREAGIIVAEGFNVRMDEQQILQFAVFGINPIAIQEIGYFDQNFTPIYFEDTDYSRRAALSGIKFHNVGKTNMVHTGSATIGTSGELYRQNNATFRANHEYYVRKWGGGPGNEEFTFPFDCAMYNLRISAKERDNPYPGDGRTDLEIVKI